VNVSQLVADQRQTMGVAGLEPALPEEDLAAHAEGIRPEATVQLVGRRVVVEPGLSDIEAQEAGQGRPRRLAQDPRAGLRGPIQQPRLE